MALDDIHYEVFLKPHRKASWRLVEARESKDEAMALAKAMLKETPSASIRVTKEKWIAADGGFRSYAIFEAGDKFQDDDRAARTADIPCRSPADLCNAHARETVGRALKGWLRRHVATPMELMHRVDLVEKLEASGTEFQHAVQKVAIASASSEQANVQTFIKQINDLIQRSIEGLYTAHRAEAFPVIKKGGFAAVVAELSAASNRDFRLRGAIAGRLMNADDWKAKVTTILDLGDEAVAMGAPASEWPIALLGEFLVDFVADETARAELLGGVEDLGDELDAFTDLLASQENLGLSSAGRRLAQAFAKDRFFDVQRSIARRVLAGLTSPKRLKPGRIRAEITLNRSIADRLIKSVGRLLSQEELVEAFVYRSGRLLDTDAIEALIASARGPSEEVFSLIELEDNIVGAANKAKLAGYVRTRLVSLPMENHFLKSADSPARRLSSLAAIRAAVDGSTFAQDDKAEIGEKIDRFAVEIEARVQLFTQVLRRAPSPLEGAIKLLELIEKGLAPRGALEADARARAAKTIADPKVQAAIRAGDMNQARLAHEVMRRLGGEPAPSTDGRSAA